MVTTDLKGGQLRTGRTELDVAHLGGTRTFILPLVGPNYHKDVMGQIDSQKLYRPTTAEVFSLANVALQNSNEPNCAEIVSRFRNNYFWTATENLWVSDGVIVYDNTDGKMPSTRKDLTKRIEAGDKSVRFVPKGFKRDEQSVEELLKNPYLIAQVGGEEMLPIVEQVAKTLKRKPYVWALDDVTSDTHRFTALDSYWYDIRLSLDGYCNSDYDDGCASGVSVVAPAGARAKK